MDSKLTEILQDCLERLQAGESIAACVARYPDQAGELAPMLHAAESLARLGTVRLPEPSRVQGKAMLRQALSAPRPHPLFAWNIFLPTARGFALATAAVLLLFVVFTVNAVASSEPGQLAYRLRIVAERVPAWLETGPSARAATELAVAARRYEELENHFRSTQVVSDDALRALLVGDEAALQAARELPEAIQAQVSARVMEHASGLASLAQHAAGQPSGKRLEAAALQVRSMLNQSGHETPATHSPEAPHAVSPLQPARATDQPAVVVTPPTSEQTPSPVATDGAEQMRHRHGQPTATPEAPAVMPTQPPAETPPAVVSSPEPTADPVAPGPGPSGPEATAPAPAPGSGDAGDGMGPGPAPTNAGPDPAATPNAPLEDPQLPEPEPSHGEEAPDSPHAPPAPGDETGPGPGGSSGNDAGPRH